jgi:hypothetical protein
MANAAGDQDWVWRQPNLVKSELHEPGDSGAAHLSGYLERLGDVIDRPRASVE